MNAVLAVGGLLVGYFLGHASAARSEGIGRTVAKKAIAGVLATGMAAQRAVYGVSEYLSDIAAEARAELEQKSVTPDGANNGSTT